MFSFNYTLKYLKYTVRYILINKVVEFYYTIKKEIIFLFIKQTFLTFIYKYNFYFVKVNLIKIKAIFTFFK